LKRISIIFLLISFSSLFVFSKVKNNGIPFINNFPRSQYKGGTQNWDITQTPNGLLYFANNEGVLEFDGNNWRVIPMPNNSVVRSLAVDSLGQVFVGASNEFGYLQPDNQGKLNYHSLVDLLPDDDREFEEVWQIFPYKKGILFHSFQKIFYYRDGAISQIQNENEFHFSFLVGDQFYVREQKRGLCVLDGRSVDLVKGGELFADIEIVSLLPLSSNLILIATALDGLFLYDGTQITPWNNDLSQRFKRDQVFTGLSVGNSRFAFGTVRNGVYIINMEGQIIQNINTEKGLQNNTVLSLFLDQKENLWVGLDNGIDYLEISSPLSIFPKDKDLGAGYASIVHDGYLYLGTNTGLFTRKYDFSLGTENGEGAFELVKNTSGQVWNLQVVDGELICGHNKGTFSIDKKEGKLISDIAGGWNYLYKKEFPNVMIGGTYTGLVLYEKSKQTNDKWKFVQRIEGFSESSREMVWNSDNTIWMCHGYKGVYHLFLNEGFDKCIKSRYYGVEDGFQSNLGIDVHKLRDDIVFSCSDGFYKYVAESDRFEPHQSLNNLFDSEEPVNKLFEQKNGDVWFFQAGNVGLLKSQVDNSYEMLIKPFAPLKSTFIGAFENVTVIDKENVLFGNEDGFVHYDPTVVKKYNDPYQALIREVHISGTEDSIIYYGTYFNAKAIQFDSDDENRIVLAYKSNAIRFRYSAPQYSNPELIRYQCQLIGFDEIPSPWASNFQKEYTNLPEGRYVFEVISENQYGVQSAKDTFNFTISPPWYRSHVAFVIYVILALLCIYATTIIIRYRITYLQNQLKKKQEEELRLKEQKFREEALIAEKEIVQLRNDKLRSEVDFKTRELAGSTMNIIHKNEVLSYSVGELKKALKKIKDPTALVQVRQLMKTIDAEFNSDHDWEQFEVHFDQVHEDFLKRLRFLHPQLTPKDLRICAYLRMNLSSKEIAPLMNISVRGVEISRYRLRKKFNIGREENLIDFILNV
jgi:DNA-binding CsgD family transcriptional regulator/ligand-binding sensor domain-containing protein